MAFDIYESTKICIKCKTRIGFKLTIIKQNRELYIVEMNGKRQSFTSEQIMIKYGINENKLNILCTIESIDKNVCESQIINKEKTNYKFPPGLPKRKHKTKKRKAQIPSPISECNKNNINGHNENINDTKEDNNNDNKPNIMNKQNYKGQMKENMDVVDNNNYNKDNEHNENINDTKEDNNNDNKPNIMNKQNYKGQMKENMDVVDNNNYNKDNEHNENINDTKEDNKPNINDTKEQNHKGQIKDNMDGINDNGKSEAISISDLANFWLVIERLEKEKQQMAIQIGVLQKKLKDVYSIHDANKDDNKSNKENEIKQKPIDESNNDLNVVANGIINDIINDVINGKSHNKSLSHKENTQKIKQKPNNIDNIHNAEPYVNDHDPNECKSVDIEQDNNGENEVSIVNNYNNTNDNNKIEEKHNESNEIHTHIINHQQNRKGQIKDKSKKENANDNYILDHDNTK
eukprot:397589_1